MSPSLTEPVSTAPQPSAAPLTPTQRVRVAARAAVGVDGNPDVPTWRAAVPTRARRRINALATLNVAEKLPFGAALALLPQIADDKGWTTTSVGLLFVVGALVSTAVAVPASGRVSPRTRSRMGLVVAFNAAVLGLLINLLPAFAFLVILVLLRAVFIGQAASLWRPFVHEAVVPEARTRATARFYVGGQLGWALGVGAGVLCVASGLGTGQALLLAGGLAVVLSLAAFFLTDPESGGVEPARLKRAMGHVDDPFAGLRPRWRDSIARVSSIRTVRQSLTSYVAVGWTGAVLIVPVLRTGLKRDATSGQTLGQIAIAFAVSAIVGIAIARGLEKNRRQSPESLARFAPLGVILAFAGMLLLGAVPVGIGIFYGLALTGGVIAIIALDVTTFSVVQPEDRPAASALTNFSLIGGGLTGLLLVELISSATKQPAVGIALAAFPILLFWKASKRIPRLASDDLDARLGVNPDTFGFEESVDEAGETPVLSARNLDFSYGSVQVLFDVNIRIGEGEMVALLGPNGVGKTTLLRVLSGLEKPRKGTIRLGGVDITDVPSARRVSMGLSQIVGGNAVFGSMTVAENLQMYGFSEGRDRKTINDGIEQAFAVFPRLGDRRNQLGSTLSGGEQQMLGLSKALITKPRLLIVDEFSLGLAPVIVGELLGMVRALNANGVATLIVEQSVNVALNLVDRCYFMEKGQIVYEGRAEELRANPELVQALSLGGAHHEAAGSPA